MKILKTEAIHARCLPEEKQALLMIAQQDRRWPSDALRELVRQEAKRRGLWPPPPNSEAS